jgi:hypothetical protein
MVDRRSFISSSIAFATAVAVGKEAQARREAVTPAEMLLGSTVSAVVLVDRSLRGSAEFAAATRPSGLVTLQFTADVARLWMHELEPRLRFGPTVIAGYTSDATWFCLDLLARDFGASTVQHAVDADAVRFVISQTPGRRAPLAPAAVRAQWSSRHA